MKKSHLMGLATSLLLLSGCGSSTGNTESQSLSSNSSSTITVERGTVLNATVIDANGQKAQEDGNGKYTFNRQPTYPVMATGGVIDIDKDGNVSIGDVTNDMNLTTTKGSVITVVTTLASNPKTKTVVDKIATDLNISVADIESQTPSTSKEIEAISNIAYKYMKENNITDMLDTNNAKLVDLNISQAVQTEYNRYKNDAGHDVASEEKKLMQELENTHPSSIHKLSNDADVQGEITKIETEHANIDAEIENVKNNLLVLKNNYEKENGDMNYEDSGSHSSHYQGVNCAKCHSGSTLGVSRSEGREGSEGGEGSGGSENSFSSGATIFTTLHAQNSDATKAANNYSLRLVLSGSNTIENYSLGRGTGNVHASFNAGITSYTAEVLDASGNVVNSSLTGSHDASRFDCNRCHTSAGLNGAPGRIVSFKYSLPAPVTSNTNTTVTTTTNTSTGTTTTTGTTTGTTTTNTSTGTGTTTGTTTGSTTGTTTVAAKSFANDVLPILNSKCASCHGGSGRFSITNNTPYAGVTPFVTTMTPTSSRLLQKASGTISHGGGTVLATTTASYVTIRDWITEGAKNN